MSPRQPSFLPPLLRRRGRALACLALAGGLLLGAAFIGAPRAEETAQLTNLDLVRRITDDAVNKMMSDLPPSGKRVRIRVEPYHEAAWLVQDLVGKVLRARGCDVVVVPLTPVAAPAPGAAGTPPGVSGQAAAGQAPPAPSGPPSGAAAAGAALQTSQGMAPPDTARAAGAGAAGQAPADSTAGASEPGSAGEAGSAGGAPGAGSAGGAGSAPDEAKSAAGDAALTTTGSIAAAEKAKAEIVPVDAELDLRVVELGLRYTDTHRSFPLFGDKKVERYALASLHGELHEPDDPVIRWSGSGEAKVIDEVSKDDLAILEGQRYPFTAPALPAQGASRWAEPLIVSAIVIGLVFLFVSNKS